MGIHVPLRRLKSLYECGTFCNVACRLNKRNSHQDWKYLVLMWKVGHTHTLRHTHAHTMYHLQSTIWQRGGWVPLPALYVCGSELLLRKPESDKISKKRSKSPVQAQLPTLSPSSRKGGPQHSHSPRLLSSSSIETLASRGEPLPADQKAKDSKLGQ